MRFFAACVIWTIAAFSIAHGQSATPALIPQPREVKLDGTASAICVTIRSGENSDDRFAAQDLQEALRARGVAVGDMSSRNCARIELLRRDTPAAASALQTSHAVFDPPMHDEGYLLISQPGHLRVIAETAAGVFYGAQTLKQWFSGSGSRFRFSTGTLRDWPAMRYRGISDDLSRGPFPTLTFQEKQIAQLAASKMNVYSPYMEHVLEYGDSLFSSPPASALTPEDVRALVAYAAQRHVTIVPEQEAFGHLHHLLQYEKYSDLAESPHGHVLAPGQPGTQAQIFDWFSQIAAEFPGPFLHIGADETFELGTGKTRAEVQKRGLGPVYADFLAQIHSTLAPLHRRLLFWGDVAWNDPSAVQRIPKDMIAVPWIYWHEDNYDANITPFRNVGIETWVAPGDANWNVVYPDANAAIDNIQGFVEAGQRLGSHGELLAVWNDDGEGLFNMDWFGVLFGAAAGWQPGRSSAAPYAAAFGASFFNDTSGKINAAQKELSAAASQMDVSDKNFWLDPWSAAGLAAAAKQRGTFHEGRLHAERALELLLEAERDQPRLLQLDAVQAMELGARRIDFIAMKYQLSEEMADAYAKAYAMKDDPKRSTEMRNLLDSISSMNGRCQDLRDGYAMLKDLYGQAWLRENRPYWLNNVTVRYDLRIQLWQQRGEAMQRIIDDFETTHMLPTAAQAGLPAPAEIGAKP